MALTTEVSLLALDPAAHRPHVLHDEGRDWPETNCYVDLWVELLHASGAEPLAALPFTIAIDFEGDQWRFFKFPPEDLFALFGIDVFELNVWRPLVVHLEEQLALGRSPIVEVDAYHLPDTAGTTYRTEHVKSSIAIHGLDVDAGWAGYFHNAGYYELRGEDFAGAFRLDHLQDDDHLPPYVETVKWTEGQPLPPRELFAASLDLLHKHLARRPVTNPFHRYAPRLAADLEWLAGGPLARFHGYAFATFRQFGAAFELAGSYLRWLEANGERGPGDKDEAAAACGVIAETAKALQFKTARLVGAGRRFDAAPMLEAMAQQWDLVMTTLTDRYGALVRSG